MHNAAKQTARTSRGSVAGHRLEPGTGPMLLTLGLGVFAGALDLSVLSPALTSLGIEFDITPALASLAITIYLLATVASIPIASKLADRYGRRPIYIACVSIFLVGSLVTIAAPHYAVFLLGRAIQAIGAGGIFPVATAAIADRIPPERRGGALGILGAIWGLAGILGPLVGGILTAALSWRWIFIANIPLAIFVILLAQKHLPNKAPAKRGPLDVGGLISLTVGLIAVMIALTSLDPSMAALSTNITSGIALAVAVVSFAALAWFERAAKEPVLSPLLFQKREIAITYGLEIFIGAVEGSIFFVPAALHAGLNLSPAFAGAIAAVGALLFVGVIPFAGRMLDRVGARAVLGIGALSSTIGLVIFAFGYTSLALSFVAMIFSGIGFGALLGAPTRYIITQEAPPEMRSTAIGILSIFLIIGQLVGASLAGGLIHGSSLITGNYRIVYLAFAVLGCVALTITRFLAPPKMRPVA